MKHILRAYTAIQKKEILEYKDYLSEKAGYELKNNEVMKDWIKSGHAQRFHEIFYTHVDNLEKVCEQICGSIEDCNGIQECPISLKDIHKILED